ncbi:MAG: superoxide dismutase [Flavobacteriales bacterium]|nr:superoxide dismutase [Flavobacteriales bacterium]MBK6944302.1 superoxide dismutase [Flavobacteriales bacterium]MBK7240502.1 superoxide dismutase [Flavobacteriales bacterium]MBK7295201.1 superoxide dismutase [Flavobacteriales bacterium]MBK9533970.1 superoxide dismutase [Flavobacteriales bacterium]
MDRKQFLSRSLKATVGTLVAGPLLANTSGCNSPESPEQGIPASDGTPGSSTVQVVLSQIALPYAYNALEPAIDAETMEIHYSKHHAGYVKKGNAAIEEGNVKAANEMDLMATIGQYGAGVRNNVGGTWNHNMFWEVMAPASGTLPIGKVLDAINGSFGSLDEFKTAFADAGMKRFGSGWAWLVERNGKLEIGSTPNQDNPLMDVSEFKGKPLLCLDVWEHAYYLHYQNKRNDYVANWWSIVNWDAVAKRWG